MKYLFITLIALVGCTASRFAPQSIFLTVTHIQKEGLKTEVYARRGYMVWRAEFQAGQLPDSVKVGTRLRADNSTKDTCTCIFKRIK